MAVEVAGRLVGENQGRLHDGGAGDGDALALAAGKLVGRWSARLSRPKSLSARATRRWRSAGAMPASIIGRAMFSAAVRRGTR